MIGPDEVISTKRAWVALRSRGSKNIVVAHGVDAVRIVRVGSREGEHILANELPRVAGVFDDKCKLNQIRENVRAALEDVAA